MVLNLLKLLTNIPRMPQSLNMKIIQNKNCSLTFDFVVNIKNFKIIELNIIIYSYFSQSYY